MLSYTPSWGEKGRIAVATLMGGEIDESWREYPDESTILIGTQDILMSRALNRGYAMSPRWWPMEFGLLNVDAFWVMDEVQLMGPARTTSAQLQLFAQEAVSNGKHLPSRHTLWMSATLDAAEGERELPPWMKTPELSKRKLRFPAETPNSYDLANEEFRARWDAPKRLMIRFVNQKEDEQPQDTGWTTDSNELRGCIKGEIRSEPNRTVLIFVNRVDRARELCGLLRNDAVEAEILLIHARFRPRDRAASETRLNEPAPPNGRIVVSTQVLEAGVDLDAHALFTEVCPWPSFVQRLGRLNRRGKQEASVAVVIDVPKAAQKEGEAAGDYDKRAWSEARPYDLRDLDVTREHLREIGEGGDVSPKALAKIAAPVSVAGPVLRRFDLDDFFDTDPDLAGGFTDVAPFVRTIDRDTDAYVLWRRLDRLPPDEQPPVHPDELCPVPAYEAEKAFAGHDIWVLTLATRKRKGSSWRRVSADQVRAGDTVMVDISAGCYSRDDGWLGRGHSERRPDAWVDRWETDGKAFRIWSDGGEPSLGSIIDERVNPDSACGEDPRSFARNKRPKCWMELTAHLVEAERHARNLAAALHLDRELADAIATAARWHDVGKALERKLDGKISQPFQLMLLKSGFPEDGDPKPDALYAKSNRIRPGITAGFRHEVASALAYLAQPEACDLVAYLIIAHHSLVRVLPSSWEKSAADANGVRLGDRVPKIVLPDGGGNAFVELEPERFLSSPSAPSWQGRVVRQFDRFGPFGLAYLEALVQVADWRAS